MTPTAHHAKSPAAKTASFATLAGLRRTGGSGAPSLWLLVLLTLSVVAFFASLAVFALSAAPASAAVTHEFLSEITEVPVSSGAASTGPLNTPNAMTVDSGSLYLADGGSAAGRLDAFDSTTLEWKSQFELLPSFGFQGQGVAVGHGTGETQVYLGGGGFSSAVAVYGPAGSLLGTWTGADTPAGEFGCFECSDSGDVAVDQSSNPLTEGHVYVAAPEQGVVDVFKPKAGGGEEYLTQITEREAGVPLQDVHDVAVDSQNGDVLLAEANAIDVLEPSGPDEFTLLRRIAATPAGPFTNLRGLAVDPGKGEVYAADLTGSGGVVDQFSLAGAFLGRLSGRPGAKGFHTPSILRLAVAVDPASHRLFVADTSEGAPVVDVFSPDLILPDVETKAPSEVKPHEATLNGTVDSDSAGEAKCQFEWGTSKGFGETAICEPESVPDGSSPIPVHAQLTGLQPDTTYFYRLQASNENGANPGEAGEDQEFTTPGPGIHSTSASAVSADSATLEATIDPHGAPTSYYFQYGTSTAYGTSVPAPPGPSIGSGEGDVEVSQHLQGLQPHSVYHYRVVAHSQLGSGEFEEAGPDQTFTTQLSAAGLTLPDHRAWELVSPPDKHGALLQPIAETGVSQAATGGDAFTYLASAPTEADPQGYSNKVQVLSTRGSAGWSSRDIPVRYEAETGASVGSGNEYRFFSSDLSLALLDPFSSVSRLSPDSSEPTPYLRTDFPAGSPAEFCTSSCYRPLLSGCPEVGEPCPPSVAEHADVPAGTAFGNQSHFRGATPDLSHVVLDSSVGLTETPGAEGGGLYEYSADRPPAEALQLISVLPAGEPTKPENDPQLGFHNNVARNAISADGSRVVFSEGPGPTTNHHLYLRDLAREETVQLDAVQDGSGSGGVAPQFQLASADGSRVFFTDPQQLSAGSGSKGSDLYECQIVESGGEDKCDLTDLSPETAGQPADVQGFVVGASEDGSSIYFVANGALSPGAVHGNCTSGIAQSDAICNLYHARFDGAQWQTSLVAVLSNPDEPDWAGQGFLLSGLTARVSPNGRWLAFMSQRPLTGYDNRDTVSGKPDEEVFLYDATAEGGNGKLICASCTPTGARPHGKEYGEEEDHFLYGGDRVWNDHRWLAANIPGWTPYQLVAALYQSRYLSNSGRLFFNAADALVSADTNANEDVYQYEPLGSEAGTPASDTCTTASPTYNPASQGCVDLVSSGTSAKESAFLDASETGNDVFFLTYARLSGQDTDTSLDLYDARVGGGFPEAVKPVRCEGDACQQPANPPGFETPGTSILDGPGNAVECPKGKVRRSGKCVARKHHKSKHRKKAHGKKSHRRTAGNKRGGGK